MPEHKEIATDVFEEIRESFPEFAMRDSESHDGEPQLEVPAQHGLGFDVVLYLYGDVLNMSAGHFWGEWFPCSKPEVVSAYVEAVAGLLSGRFRIVEHSRRGRFLKAFLQRPSESGWRIVFRHYHGFSFPWFCTEQRVLQKVAA